MTMPGDQEIQRDDPILTSVGLMETLVEHWLLCDSDVIEETDDDVWESGMATLSPCDYAWRSFLNWITREEGPELEAWQVTVDTFHWLMRNRFRVVIGFDALNYIGIRFGTL